MILHEISFNNIGNHFSICSGKCSLDILNYLAHLSFRNTVHVIRIKILLNILSSRYLRKKRLNNLYLHILLSTMIFNGAPINRNKNAYPFGMAALIGIAYLLKGGRHKLVFGAATLFVAYALMYSQCRGAFFCTVAGVLILLLSEIRAIYKKNPAKATLFAVLMILAFAAGYIAIKNSDFSRLVDSDSTSGRETGIRNAWNMFLGSDLFGKIFGSGFMYEQLHSDTVGAHLVYLTLLVSTGLIGMTLVVLIFASTFRRVRGDIPLALCSFAFVRTFFEGMDYYIYIPLILGTIIFNCFELNGRSCNELFAVKKR